MRLRRVLAISFAVFGVFVLSCLLYLALGDLGRHKERIESLVTHYTGRAFVIDGAFELKLFPTITVLAERVRFANADWGSKPQMAQVGHLSAKIRFWSLVSGPIEVRSLELSDVDVLLEKRGASKANWIMHEAAADQDDESEPKTRTAVPLVIEKATLTNARVTYRASGKPEMVARLDTLTISSGQNHLLTLNGSGKLDQYPISLKGEAGPIHSLLTGRDIRMNLTGTLGRLELDVDGGFGDLDPLDGANLKIKASGADVGAMLARLNLPAIADGALDMSAQLKDAGKRTQFTFAATVGDLAAKAGGSLKGLYLRDSDINFEITAADAARLAGVFGIADIPAAPLTMSGHLKPGRHEIAFDAIKSQLAGMSAQLDGTLKRAKNELELRFQVSADNLANLHAGLPKAALATQGNFAWREQELAVSDLTAEVGGNHFSGSFSMTRGEPRRFEADLTSPRIDLTPFLPSPPPADAKPDASAPKTSHAKDALLFSDAPLPIRQLKGTEAKLHIAVAELDIANQILKDVDSTAIVDRDHVELHARGRGSLEGTVQASLSVTPVGDDNASVNLQFGLDKVRAGLDMKDMEPGEVPPLSVDLTLTTQGSSARQMAASSNGHMLATQGPGKTKASFLGAFGGDVINQLRGKLNPFRTQDPFTKLECTVVRVDIKDGAVTVQPVLMQTEKVTVVASGKVDLHNEHLTVDFDTRPRKGIGVSPGMFTTPFIRLEGSLMNPRLAVGAKGVTSGAVAAATGGLSVIAGGFIDRVKGEANMCRSALEEATETKSAK